MKRSWHRCALACALGLLGGWSLTSQSAQAQMQNTYADVPFNQGSLFYRPSGARPPATTSAPPRRVVAPVQPAPTYYYNPATRSYYYYPTSATYYYPQTVAPRRRLFGGLFR